MNKTNWAEKIGFALIIIGFVFMLLEDLWKNNPIPKVLENNNLFYTIGLLIWALGYMITQADQKNKHSQ